MEKELGIHFPLDYIECVMKKNGAHVSPEVFEVEGKRKVFGT
ncbi:SMI1/KNR4 family protein [Bacillus cereus]|nr:SMI1/KNR4 family protein [Bacillus cereus]